jgi:SAM-dependent methyltransferase
VITFNQAQYDDLAIKSQDIYAHTKYDILERYLVGHAKLRILNVGCGSGDLSLRLAARGHDVTGIDVEAAYIDLALANAAATKAPGRCSFAVSSIEDYAGAGDFDCVVSTDVLEHIADDRGAFTKMVSLVRPGGLILITVPAGRWLFGYHDEQLGHFRRYNRAMLRNLVSTGCDVRRMRYFGFTLIPVCWLYSRWLRRPYPVAESADTRQRPLRALVLRTLMKLERWLPLPAGTSLLLSGIKK